ncbi:hypothetical protein CDAR_174081 [Caerostris darwini]|uniref:Uncharacterized protein n=1 Tax=Caerostris darwini TaxID=1538125 RepID=A0AAV4VK58_9ARAC|nr:hypothetical protein CDAR_174081 [Caerostris darwini]
MSRTAPKCSMRAFFMWRFSQTTEFPLYLVPRVRCAKDQPGLSLALQPSRHGMPFSLEDTISAWQGKNLILYADA